jgi:hypothetical protein
MRARRKLSAPYAHLAFGVSLSVLSAQKLWLKTRPRGEGKDKFIIMDMRWTNWLGLAMLLFLLVIHELILPIIGFCITESDSTKILWAIPVAAYVIIAAVLLIRGGSDRDLS